MVVSEKEQSVTTPHVYAIGDIADDKLELTPVAIQAGKLLAQRLYGGSTELVSRIAFLYLTGSRLKTMCRVIPWNLYFVRI